MPLTEWSAFVSANKVAALRVRPVFLNTKGSTDANLYLTLCNPTTGKLVTTGDATGGTPTELGAFNFAHGDKMVQTKPVVLLCKGNADNNLYFLESNTTTGVLITSG